jgi:hypothetical protein
VVSSGATITITGTALDSVSKVVIGGVSVTPTKISAAQITLAAPVAPSSTAIRLEQKNGNAITLSQTVRVDPVFTVTGWSPVYGLSTNATNVTLVGSGLAASNGVAGVRYGNNAVANIVSQSDTTLIFTVPVAAVTGPVTLVSGLPGFQYTVGTFTVYKGISANGLSPSAGPAQTAVRVTGTGLDTVTTVSVGGVAVSIKAQTASTLDFLAPAASGYVVLSAPGNQSVTAGSFAYQPAVSVPPITGTAPTITVSIPRVELAQTYSQPISSNSSVALVAGKAALLRAFVVASASTSAPVVTATLAGCAASPSLTLKGPSTLPISQPASTDLNTTFVATVPSSCVTASLAVTVNVAAGSASAAVSSASQVPRVARANTPLDIVLIPLTTNGATAKIPTASDVAALKQMFDTTYPLAAPFTITVRAPFALATNPVTSSSQFSRALDEVKKLWDTEVPNGGKVYYGFVADPKGTGADLGKGYENSVGDKASSAWMVAIGEEIPKDSAWINTLAHEVGHNHSLKHAPCGGPGSSDPNWPTAAQYVNAGLGASPIYDRNASPAVMTQPNAPSASTSTYGHDIMSYCNSQWFSDYNYANIQSFINTFNYARQATFPAAVEMLDFSGEITPRGVTFFPTIARMSLHPYQGAGEWTLRLGLANGTEVVQTFQPVMVADGEPGLAHFSVSVAKTAEVVTAQVEYFGTVYPQVLHQAHRAAATSAPVDVRALELPAPSVDQPVHTLERNGQLKVRWDAARHPFLDARHVGTGVTLLGLRATGGYAEFDLTAVPAGGSWEFGLSNGLSAKVYGLPRTN